MCKKISVGMVLECENTKRKQKCTHTHPSVQCCYCFRVHTNVHYQSDDHEMLTIVISTLLIRARFDITECIKACCGGNADCFSLGLLHVLLQKGVF